MLIEPKLIVRTGHIVLHSIGKLIKQYKTTNKSSILDIQGHDGTLG